MAFRYYSSPYFPEAQPQERKTRKDSRKGLAFPHCAAASRNADDRPYTSLSPH
jgi:hypothetical protein